ncbi:MAG: peptide MFS transporter [Planctomycetes bacterium]|nr:peptide MFS transporter [Planctomycetota bacterium]
MEKERHPPGLIALFTTEMWERFGFYLMLGILPLYLEDSQKGGMGWTDKQAAVLIGSYIALVYFTPFIGGLIADRLLGCRRSIVIGGVLMMLGYFLIAWPAAWALYLGLGLVILGNGAFKPNISTILGNLYPPGSKLKDAGYNIFYMGINLGAFACNIVAAMVRNYFDRNPLPIASDLTLRGWSAAFATAGFGMLTGLIIFLCNFRGLAKADPDPQTRTGPRESLRPLWLRCLLPAAVAGALCWCLADPKVVKWVSVDLLRKSEPLYKSPLDPATAAFLGACLPVIFFYLSIWRGVPDREDRGRVGALLTIFGVVIIFWAIFHLNTTALTVWTRDNTTRQAEPAAGSVERVWPAAGDFIRDSAEDATPKYYFNAGADVPRPPRSDFVVVSKEKYKEMEEKKELEIKEGEPIHVTKETFDKVFQNTTAETPALDKGKHLKLVNTELFQSINAGFVVLFTPLLVAFWHWLRLRGKEPSTSAKIGLGLLLTACGPLVMLAATASTDDGATKGSAGWLFEVYAVVTLGELCLSPMGLSLVNKMAPANIRAFMMGGWFLSTSFGNKLSGVFGELYQEMNHYTFWTMLAGSGAFFAGVIFVLLPWLNRQMTERKA